MQGTAGCRGCGWEAMVTRGRGITAQGQPLGEREDRSGERPEPGGTQPPVGLCAKPSPAVPNGDRTVVPPLVHRARLTRASLAPAADPDTDPTCP